MMSTTTPRRLKKQTNKRHVP